MLRISNFNPCTQNQKASKAKQAQAAKLQAPQDSVKFSFKGGVNAEIVKECAKKNLSDYAGIAFALLDAFKAKEIPPVMDGNKISKEFVKNPNIQHVLNVYTNKTNEVKNGNGFAKTAVFTIEEAFEKVFKVEIADVKKLSDNAR